MNRALIFARVSSGVVRAAMQGALGGPGVFAGGKFVAAVLGRDGFAFFSFGAGLWVRADSW